MTLLNRLPEAGPTYDDQGRLLGGLRALEDLARVCSPGFDGAESPRMYGEMEEDPAYEMAVAEARVVPVSPSKSGDESSDSGDGVNSDDVDEVLEDVHFDDDDPAHEPSKDREAAGAANQQQPRTTSPSHQMSGLSLSDAHPSGPSLVKPTSPRSDTTVIKPATGPKPGPSQDLLPGDALKQRFLDLGIVSTLLVREPSPPICPALLIIIATGFVLHLSAQQLSSQRGL